MKDVYVVKLGQKLLAVCPTAEFAMKIIQDRSGSARDGAAERYEYAVIPVPWMDR